MTFDQQIKIITRVMGQAPRYSSSLAGARTNEPYAAVDDMREDHTIFIHGDTIEEAMDRLYHSVRRRYPLVTDRHLSDVLGEEEA